MTHRRIQKAHVPVDIELTAVPSKSDTHRALVAAALASGRTEVVRPLDAIDTRKTRDGLAALGFAIGPVGLNCSVEGRAGRVPGGGTIDCGPSGTTCRLLTAVAALGEAPTRIDGAPRLRERPLQPLVAALARLGASISGDPRTGGLPVTAGGRAPVETSVSIPGYPSSQFASALLLIGPCLPEGLHLDLARPLVSRPYLDLTVRTMRAFGADVRVRGDGLAYDVTARPYRATRYAIEGDWSAASYWLSLPAVVGGRVRVRGLRGESAQPDARFTTLLAEAGLSVRHDEDEVEIEGGPGVQPFDFDATHCPDLVPTLAVVALASDGSCRIRGLSHLRYKESDRLDLIAHNLRNLGAAVRVDGDVLAIDGGSRLEETVIETRSDHRIAMAFAVLGLRSGNVLIDDATCVAKSNPSFWSDLARIERVGVARQN